MVKLVSDNGLKEGADRAKGGRDGMDCWGDTRSG